MKNLIALILVSVFSATVFTQCTKDDLSKDFTVNFYTSEGSGKMSLFIDDEYKGELSYMATIPECGKDYGDGAAPLSFVLKTGCYKIVGKDAQGQVVSESVLRIRANGVGGSGRVGGNRVDSRDDDCLAVGLYD